MINGDDLVPDDLTALLGATPRLGVLKNEPFLASHGKKIIAQTGMWHFGGDYRDPPNLDEQITELLSGLPSEVDLWGHITRRFNCCMSVGGYLNGWTGGVTLSPATLKMLFERNLPIDFDLYAPTASN
ncbi:MAG: DUF4279 domain-containing protein [Sphingomonadaceae bacterium]|nr:DUF4279 domain-containing protein [Sphingomonadaceae bacterium]